jgi:hypothetical protein
MVVAVVLLDGRFRNFCMEFSLCHDQDLCVYRLKGAGSKVRFRVQQPKLEVIWCWGKRAPAFGLDAFRG